MPLFRKGREPLQRPVLTINHRAQPQPEATGPFPRRFRLIVECQRRLADHPAAAPGSAGVPLGDGHGLEELVGTVAPLFAREPSLVRWVALRGALADLYAKALHPESAIVSMEDIEAAMGLEWTDRGDESHAGVASAWQQTLPEDVERAVLGVAASVLTRAESYATYETMSVQDLNAHQAGRTMSPALALDTIAWISVAILRLEIGHLAADAVPEPDLLDVPGWYTEPLFAKSERYWNGTDWTDACRARDGRDYVEGDVPLD